MDKRWARLTPEQKRKRSGAVLRCRAKRIRKLKEAAGGKCVICGYSKCFRALEFHHVDPHSKKFAVSVSGNTKSWKRMIDEAAKCALVCSNRHREVEDGITPQPAPLGEEWKQQVLACGLMVSHSVVTRGDGGSTPSVPANIHP